MMSRSEMSNILGVCLERLESGQTVEEIIVDFPDKARELRELLKVARAVVPPGRPVRVPASAQVDSRKRLLAEAQQMQQQDAAGFFGLRPLRLCFLFLQRHMMSVAFTVTALALLIVAFGSVKALPGDELYPVKLAAEQAGITFSSSNQVREQRENVYDTNRAAEVAQMIHRQRTGSVNFGGFLKQTPGNLTWQVDAIPLQLNLQTEKQASQWAGIYVEITGRLDQQGEVQVETLQPHLEQFSGTLNSMDAQSWQVSGKIIPFTGITQISGVPRLGSQVTLHLAHLQNDPRGLALSAEFVGGVTDTPTATVTETITSTAPIQPTDPPQPTETAAPVPTRTAIPVLSVPTPAQQEEEHHDTPSTRPTPTQPDHHDDSEGGHHDDSSTKPKSGD